MKKRAQLDISFGFIFGIIIIAVIIAVAIYVMVYFMRMNCATQTGIFYQDLQDEIDKAWAGSITSKTYSGKIPGSIESVCFGSLDLNPLADSRTQYESLIRFKSLDKNAFLYPSEKACSAQLANHKLEHVNMTLFFCVNVTAGKASLKISKGTADALVTLSK